MTSLIRTQTLALDTAQLGDWARDRASPQADRRRKTERFARGLAEQGVVVMLSWHHVEELLGTQSVSAASAAMDLLVSLPAVAWLEPADGDEGLATIVDMLAVELKAALDDPAAGPGAIRDSVLQAKLRTGSGAYAMARYASCWRDLQPVLWEDARHRREVFAITTSNLLADDRMKVRDVLKAGARSGAALDVQFAKMQLALQRDLTAHADTRIDDHAGLSRAFFDKVRQAGARATSGADLLHWILDQQGVTLDELDPDATMGEVMALGHFRQQMANAAQAGGLDPARVKAVAMDRLPSWLMERALRKHRQRDLERRGSEPNDAHLAGLAAYCDLTFVDRRTKEALRKAVDGKSLPRPLLRRVEKNRPYAAALEMLARA